MNKAFKEWCDATGNFEDEHYYDCGSKVRRRYPEKEAIAFRAGMLAAAELLEQQHTWITREAASALIREAAKK